LNLGLVLYVSGDFTAADEALARGLTKSGGLADALNLVGLPVPEDEYKMPRERPMTEEIHVLLEAVFEEIRSERAVTAAPSSAEQCMEVAEYLYWKWEVN
jgi:hypothetical protein